jgi:integrase
MKRLFRNDTWNTCYEQFLDAVVAPTTRFTYDTTLRRFFAFVYEQTGLRKTPDKITRADIEAFLHHPVQVRRNAGQPISPFTHNTYICVLKSFYSWCETYLVEFRGKNVPILRGTKPTVGVKVVPVPEADRELSDEEIQALFAQIPRDLLGLRDRALFLCLLILGRRRQECANILRGDVQTAVFIEDGKPPRPGWLYWWRGKRRLGKDDCAEIPEICLAALREFHAAAGRDFDTMPADQPLFPGIAGPADGKTPMSLSNVDRRWRQYARAAGLPDNKVVHSLRHASGWARYTLNGRDLLRVQADLRHSDVKTTMKYLNKYKRLQEGDQVAPALAEKFGHL